MGIYNSSYLKREFWLLFNEISILWRYCQFTKLKYVAMNFLYECKNVNKVLYLSIWFFSLIILFSKKDHFYESNVEVKYWTQGYIFEPIFSQQ